MSSAITEVIGRGIAIVLVTAALATFRRWVPASSVGIAEKTLDTDELEDRFMPLRGRVIGAMVAVGILFALCFW